ncbi:muconolactone Delta-isomerase family protein [Vibrio splendidus]
MYFVKVRVEHAGLTEKELWDLWEKEAEAALKVKSAGKIKFLYKITGQRGVIMVVDMEHHEIEQIVHGDMPMRNIMVLEEVIPVRDYEEFAEDVKRRWKK